MLHAPGHPLGFLLKGGLIRVRSSPDLGLNIRFPLLLFLSPLSLPWSEIAKEILQFQPMEEGDIPL